MQIIFLLSHTNSKSLLYYLNPRFQYRSGVCSDPEPLQVVHEVFGKLSSSTVGFGNIGNEVHQ